MRVIEIDLNGVNTSYELHKVFKEKLEFPDYYGMNWDAFWDSFSGYIDVPDRIILRGWDRIEKILPRDAHNFKWVIDEYNQMFGKWGVCEAIYKGSMQYELKEKSVTSLRGNTYYWTNEKKECPALVFLPGLTADHTLFEKQLEAFGDDYNLIVWDCPGHGKSRPYADFTYPNVTEEMKCILDAEDVRKAVFIGQSLGGMLAQFFIHRYPDMASGLISIDSAPFGDYYSKSDLFWLNQLEWMCRMFPDATLRSAMAKACGKTEYAQKKMIAMLSAYDKKELCHLMYLGEAAFIPVNTSIDLPCPTVLILGDSDRVGKVTPYNRRWAEKTNYPLHIVEGAAHNSNEDRPGEVNQIIREFLTTVY